MMYTNACAYQGPAAILLVNVYLNHISFSKSAQSAELMTTVVRVRILGSCLHHD